MQNFLTLNNSNTNFLNLISFFNNRESSIAFFCLFIGLALKLPIFPFHI
jgi:NADH:ubiquinone oxidoreductase subunit 4 (subunit M)